MHPKDGQGHRTYSRYWLYAAGFTLIKLFLHLFTNTNYELHRDEMLYFSMADHPAFGYATVPPMIGFMALIVKNVFGYSVFGLRLFPALAGALSILLMAKIIRDLNGGLTALVIASVSFILSPGFLLFNTLFTPNVFEQLLWLIIICLIFRMVKTGNINNWIWIGICSGLSFLTKYSVIFLITGFIMALVFSPHRKLINYKFFLAIIIALFIFLPNIYWQYQHNWPVIKHMQELKSTQLVNTRYAYFAEDIFSLTMASFFIIIFGIFSMLFYTTEKKYQFIGIACLITTMMFLISNGKGYYILGLLPFLMAYGSYALEKYFIGGRRMLSFVIVGLIVLVSLPSLPYSLPLWSFEKLDRYSEKTKQHIIYPFSRWEDGRKHAHSQVFSDMTGWNQLAHVVVKAYHQLSIDDQKSCMIYVERNYGDAGALKFYGKPLGLPAPVTFHESFVFWAPEKAPEGPMLYVNVNANSLTEVFKNIREVGVVNDPYFRENGVKVFLCTEPKVDFQKAYNEKALSEKGAFERK